jgi:hypothetical protein
MTPEHEKKIITYLLKMGFVLRPLGSSMYTDKELQVYRGHPDYRGIEVFLYRSDYWIDGSEFEIVRRGGVDYRGHTFAEFVSELYADGPVVYCEITSHE